MTAATATSKSTCCCAAWGWSRWKTSSARASCSTQTRGRSAPIKQVLLAGDIVVGGRQHLCVGKPVQGPHQSQDPGVQDQSRRATSAWPRPSARRWPPPSSRAAARCATSLQSTVSRVTSSRITSSTTVPASPAASARHADPPDQAGPALHLLLRELPEMKGLVESRRKKASSRRERGRDSMKIPPFRRRSSPGRSSTAATSCPGRTRAMPIACGSRRSCCSRRRLLP